MSRGSRFDEADFESRYQRGGGVARETKPSAQTPIHVWPVDNPSIGQSVLRDRDGKGRPHKGVDLFVPAGSEVRAMRAGKVKRVVDGRNSADESRRRAGLWIDIVARDGRLYRYLHLGTAKVRAGQTVRAGTPIGTVAPAFTSGAGERAHLHLEVREHDWRNGEYGKPIDPLTLLAA